MKIGILGSGSVGQTLGKGLIELGHEVLIGTRDPKKLADWQRGGGFVGSFADAAKFGDVVFIATLWTGTQNAISLAGKENFSGKIVIDVTNPLDFSQTPPRLATAYPKSACEQIQSWLPGAKLAKAFNTSPAHTMTNPRQLGDADLFVAGDAEAKQFVKDIAKKWGWNDVVDMGSVKDAYWIEMLGMAVIHYGLTHNDWNFALRLLRKK